MNVGRDLQVLGVVVMAPVVVLSDDPAASVFWLLWLVYAAWLQWRRPLEVTR